MAQASKAFKPDSNGNWWIEQEHFAADFAADVPPAVSHFMAQSQVPISIDSDLRFARRGRSRFFYCCGTSSCSSRLDRLHRRNLTTIYATHGHGDHFFGASVLLERFLKARFVAAPSVIQVMKEQTAPDFVQKFWESRFPGQLPKHLVVAEELSTNVIELEGESLIVVPLAFTDTAGTTCLHAPSLELIAAGDGAYN